MLISNLSLKCFHPNFLKKNLVSCLCFGYGIVFNIFLDGSGIGKCTMKTLIIGYLEFGVIYP